MPTVCKYVTSWRVGLNAEWQHICVPDCKCSCAKSTHPTTCDRETAVTANYRGSHDHKPHPEVRRCQRKGLTENIKENCSWVEKPLKNTRVNSHFNYSNFFISSVFFNHKKKNQNLLVNMGDSVVCPNLISTLCACFKNCNTYKSKWDCQPLETTGPPIHRTQSHWTTGGITDEPLSVIID